MGDIPKLYDGHHYARSYEDAVVMSLEAGVDMELDGGPVSDHVYAKFIGDAVRQGKLPMSVLDHAVTEVLKPKIQLLGLSAPKEAGSNRPAE